MAIDPEALRQFLNKPLPTPPDVKGTAPQDLTRKIWRMTGYTPQFKTDPRPHQLEGLTFALDLRRCLLTYDMRLGKTKMGLDWAQHLGLSEHWQGKGLVLVPAPILVDVWVQQSLQHTHLKVVGVTDSIERLVEAVDSDADLLVMSVSSIQAWFTHKVYNKKGKQVLEPDEDLLSAFAQFFTLVIIDEIHEWKAHLGLRFAMTQILVQNCEFRMGLTGTPFGRNPLDIWAQAFLMDDGFTFGKSYWFFEQAFTKVLKGRDGKSKRTFNTKLMPQFLYKLKSMSLSCKLEELSEGVVESDVVLHLKGDQHEAYQNMIKQVVKLKTNNRMEVENVFIRLRQVASGYLPFIDEEGEQRTIVFRNNAKMEWLAEFLSELPGGISVVIFYEFNMTGQMIVDELKKAKVTYGWLRGDTKDKPDTVARFQMAVDQVLVCNSKSGARGMDFSIAAYQLFAESPLSAITRLQAEKRAQGSARNGRPLFIDDLICSPIERRIIGMIKEGKDIMSEVFSNPRQMLGA